MTEQVTAQLVGRRTVRDKHIRWIVIPDRHFEAHVRIDGIVIPRGVDAYPRDRARTRAQEIIPDLEESYVRLPKIVRTAHVYAKLCHIRRLYPFR